MMLTASEPEKMAAARRLHASPIVYYAGLSAAIGLGYARLDLLLVLLSQPRGMESLAFLFAYIGSTNVAVSVAAAAISFLSACRLRPLPQGRALISAGFIGLALFIVRALAGLGSSAMRASPMDTVLLRLGAKVSVVCCRCRTYPWGLWSLAIDQLSPTVGFHSRFYTAGSASLSWCCGRFNLVGRDRPWQIDYHSLDYPNRDMDACHRCLRFTGFACSPAASNSKPRATWCLGPRVRLDCPPAPGGIPVEDSIA